MGIWLLDAAFTYRGSSRIWNTQGYYHRAAVHTVTISGSSSLVYGQSSTYTVSVSGGCNAAPEYYWSYRIGSGNWITLGTSSTQVVTMGTETITVRADVKKGTQWAYAEKTVYYVSNLSVTISGPNVLYTGQSVHYTSEVTGGVGTITYAWYQKLTYLGNTPDIYIKMGTTTITYVKVIVTRGNETVTAMKYIGLDSGPYLVY